MLVRSLKVPPSFFLFVAFCAFLGWQLSKAPVDDFAMGNPPPPTPQGNGNPVSLPEKKAPRIALVTFVTEERSYLHISLKTKDHLARRHGLDLIVDYESHTDRGTTWYKYNMMERLIKQNKWDWLWWLDFDTLVTNTDISVAKIIEEEVNNSTNPDNIDWLVTHDCNGLNTGSFIVRGHERSIKLLHDSFAIADREKQKGNQMSEQDALARLIKDDKAVSERVIQVPQWKLNAFPQEIACFDEMRKVWEPGYFILHFAGAWAHVHEDDPTGVLMRKYKDMVKWGDKDEIYGPK